jgi:uncharacterized protein DUF1877
MGMVVGIASLSDATIQRLLADPPLAWQVVAPDDPSFYENARREAARQAKPGIFARLFGAKVRPEAPASRSPAPLALGPGEGEVVDLDKSWHGIHYLLTGGADGAGTPLDFLVAGGAYVGLDDVGYGPPRVYTAAETREIAAALAAVTDHELRGRFDPAAMMRAEIYPEIWDRDPAEDDTLGYLNDYVDALRRASAAATSNGHGIMVYLT